MRRRLLVDTNLLVLFLVGKASPRFISKHKRTRAYTIRDFRLLIELTADASGLSTTAHVLTETSNLVRQFGLPGHKTILDAFRDFTASATERHVPGIDAAGRTEFLRLGLADAAILQAMEPGTRLLTDDLDLYLAAITAGHDAVNFSHERQRASF